MYKVGEHNLLFQGDCQVVLKELPDNSVDSCVTDPPYELGFMGKHWDNTGIAYNVDMWREVLRVLKPGGHLLSFGGTRTYHRMACAIEDAGFEIRDQIQWVYGSGFPKSLDVSKAIDKSAGVHGGRGPMKRGGERLSRLEGGFRDGDGRWGDESGRDPYTYLPTTDAARKWQGWGTALKPANEPIVLARKPLSEKTVAANVLKWGTGCINVDGCRVGTEVRENTQYGNGGDLLAISNGGTQKWDGTKQTATGRWPANLILSDEPEVVGVFPVTKSGALTAAQQAKGGFAGTVNAYGKAKTGGTNEYQASEGSAARFFKQVSPEPEDLEASRLYYCAKASKSDRNSGGIKNIHATVKPVDLMRHLCRLVTPKGGVVLDPFMGSGSTGKGAVLEGFRFIGIEREAEYLDFAKARIEAAQEIKVKETASLFNNVPDHAQTL